MPPAYYLRSNKVATCLGVQDFSQLRKDYGREQADVILNITGNIISGQVTGIQPSSSQNALEKSCRIVRVSPLTVQCGYLHQPFLTIGISCPALKDFCTQFKRIRRHYGR
ncbi:TraM recognition domain-containing protein [Flavobacterium anhuiense]|uniref:TraM recognition domain-containing protein n=1 Tax=Flavobacterium anhuiense TaxID=459526 RepID=UPI003D9939E2